MEKRLRRDLKRTHALLSDVQLLLGTMEDGKASVSKEELEKVHSQVCVLGSPQNWAWEEAAASWGGMVLPPKCGRGCGADLRMRDAAGAGESRGSGRWGGRVCK